MATIEAPDDQPDMGHNGITVRHEIRRRPPSGSACRMEPHPGYVRVRISYSVFVVYAAR